MLERVHVDQLGAGAESPFRGLDHLHRGSARGRGARRGDHAEPEAHPGCPAVDHVHRDPDLLSGFTGDAHGFGHPP